MPNLTSHVSLALAVADELEVSAISKNMGSYLLGATSPDIRIITRQSREITHYSRLDSTMLGDGVEKMLAESPDLADDTKSTPATRAFISGYITHLIADQTWILTMYKPYFGNRNIFPNEALANIWDRALQLEMDRQDRSAWRSVSSHLASATRDVQVPFISSADLTKWSEWVKEYATGSFSWERLRSLSRRQPITDDSAVERSVDDFLSDIQSGLTKILSNLKTDDIESYRNRAIQGSLRSLQAFWGVKDTA